MAHDFLMSLLGDLYDVFYSNIRIDYRIRCLGTKAAPVVADILLSMESCRCKKGATAGLPVFTSKPMASRVSAENSSSIKWGLRMRPVGRHSSFLRYVGRLRGVQPSQYENQQGPGRFFLGQGFVCMRKIPSEPCLFFRELNFEFRGVLPRLRKRNTSVAFLRGGV